MPAHWYYKYLMTLIKNKYLMRICLIEFVVAPFPWSVCQLLLPFHILRDFLLLQKWVTKGRLATGEDIPFIWGHSGSSNSPAVTSTLLEGKTPIQYVWHDLWTVALLNWLLLHVNATISRRCPHEGPHTLDKRL